MHNKHHDLHSHGNYVDFNITKYIKVFLERDGGVVHLLNYKKKRKKGIKIVLCICHLQTDWMQKYCDYNVVLQNLFEILCDSDDVMLIQICFKTNTGFIECMVIVHLTKQHEKYVQELLLLYRKIIVYC